MRTRVVLLLGMLLLLVTGLAVNAQAAPTRATSAPTALGSVLQPRFSTAVAFDQSRPARDIARESVRKAVPGALAAAGVEPVDIRPDRGPIPADRGYSGDGALYYHLTELETAKRRGIAMTLVVNNNSGFGQGWPNLVRQQGNKPGDPAEMLRFGPTDFASIARGSGVRAIRVEDPARIGAALSEAIAADETVVVDVVTNIEARAPAPWLPEGAT